MSDTYEVILDGGGPWGIRLQGIWIHSANCKKCFIFNVVISTFY